MNVSLPFFLGMEQPTTSRHIQSVSNESYGEISPSTPGYSELFPSHHHQTSLPEYVNTNQVGNNSNSLGKNSAIVPTEFNNPEYELMATDSGIGEDNISLVSRGNRDTRHCSTQSSNDSTERQSSSTHLSSRNSTQKDIIDNDVWISNDNNHTTEGDAICSPDTAMDNPEYMLLNPDVETV